jgi:ribosomal protein S18 acetylase RimI-like enzyme
MSEMSSLVRDVSAEDLDALLALEGIAFVSDRLSRRSFARWIKGENRVFLVLECDGELLGYGLVLLHKGTRLARLYSIALNPKTRGKGLAQVLMHALEAGAVAEGRLFMRLEVSKPNTAAIRLYERLGYSVFGELPNYYEDDTDALRMQKRIRFPENIRQAAAVPWYRQTTPFTCGPACLMMGMAGLDRSITLDLSLELDLWREATTIYMTSGQGGCHPLGLALAAERRGFTVEVCMSRTTTLFLDGVRSAHKKEILRVVHAQFLDRARAAGIGIQEAAVTVSKIEQWLVDGDAVIVLISSYRLNGDKAPHWVVVTASDELCFYLHDPDAEKVTPSELDCQHIPVAKDDFAKMTTYGSNRFSAAILLKGRSERLR